MRLEDIRQLTRAVPFRPFRIFLTIGEQYDIYHPDMILPTLGAVHISAPATGVPPELGGNARIVSLVHIAKIEYLAPPAPAPGANGPPAAPAE